MADKQNVHNRMQREIESAHKYSIGKVLKELLPVIDSLHQAAEISAKAGDTAISEGIQISINMFLKVLGDFGVTAIAPETGDEFDPEKHEAMSAASDKQHKDNTVLTLLQKGYDLNGRVIRAAMVVVNKL